MLLLMFAACRSSNANYAKCAECNNTVSYDELQELDDKLYCRDCLMYVMETAECKQCHRYYHVEDVDSDTELCIYCEAGIEQK